MPPGTAAGALLARGSGFHPKVMHGGSQQIPGPQLDGMNAMINCKSLEEFM
jgi:hypothetical protein